MILYALLYANFFNSNVSISNNISLLRYFFIEKSIKNTLGISGYELYDNWSKSLEKKYKNDITNIKEVKNYTGQVLLPVSLPYP